jgi:ATP-dependent RNA helicase DeaD
MTVFEGIAPVLAGALTKHGYTELTPVQVAVLEPEAAGADLLVSAQTGSGKTVAFGLAIAPELLGGNERVAKASDPIAVAVAPTRELALQVQRELEWLYEPTGAKTVSCVGGMDMRQERRTLAYGAHIVVGTPGRLCDHIRRGSLVMSSVRTLVLDEADEMLDLGFREDLEFILGAAPAERRTLMFSATVPKPIATLAKRFQRNAIRISMIQENEQHADIEYRTITVGVAERENAVINTLRYFEASSALVFCSTREGVKHLSSRLGNRGFAVVPLSGELSQNERTRALQSIRDGRARVCVATDVAARGIDLPNLDLVIHADLPKNSEALLHRSGRTGRAGRHGLSILIVPYAKRAGMERVLRAAGITAARMPPPTAAAIIKRDRDRLLNDPVLTAEPNDEELAFAQELLESRSPEQIAVAFFRQNHVKLPTPEEFVDTGMPAEKSEPSRNDFEGGVWFKLSVGRKQKAEPRWLLPLICRAGGVTRRDVGSIKIFETESQFEITPRRAERFSAAIAKAGTIDGSIRVSRAEAGRADAAPQAKERDQKRAGTKPRGKPGAPDHKRVKFAGGKRKKEKTAPSP